MTHQVPADQIPQNLQPGFVSQVPAPAPLPNVPPAPAPLNAPAPAPASVAPAQPDAFAAAVAALTAAITPPAPAAPAAAAGESLNTLPIESIDDPIIRSMATVLRTSAKGLDLDRVMGKALEHGNAGLIDVAYLREKAGANAAELQTIAEGIVSAVNAKAAASEQAVHAMAGGADTWNACSAAFSAQAPAELKAVITQMLDSGKDAQIQAAAKMVVEFAKGRGIVPTPSAMVHMNGSAPPMGQALTKEEFQAELQKLDPNARDFLVKRTDLYARRQAGKNLGR